MNRLERISAILVKLQSRPVVTAKEIAEQFHVSLRTIYRDIRSLEESGIPISGEAGMGYSLVDGFKLPPLMFTTEEAISFLMAEKLISHHTDDDTYDAFRGGMDKIRAVLKAVEKDFMHSLDEFIYIPNVYNMPPPVPGNVIQPLIKSLIHKKRVKITYRAGYSEEITSRTIEPQGIFFMASYWYILAWCKLRNNYRTFHLGRILHIATTENDFEVKHPPLEELVQTIYCNENNTEVTLRVHKDAVKMIGVGKYMNGLTNEQPDGDYFIQQYEVYSLEKFARWYLSFADQAEIIEPQELKTIVGKLIASILLNDT
ncbi:MAG: YafY family transcriptional regulator [Tannerellaceae bacterium]|jgi:predicted DNA-binding transcriptional regulator YafY|nr:YafY family transcriptional regulator [Tannerellaceae bacterium]